MWNFHIILDASEILFFSQCWYNFQRNSFFTECSILHLDLPKSGQSSPVKRQIFNINWCIDDINANPLICYSLSRVTTYSLRKSRQFIVQDLLALLGLSYLEVQEGLLLTIYQGVHITYFTSFGTLVGRIKCTTIFPALVVEGWWQVDSFTSAIICPSLMNDGKWGCLARCDAMYL